MPADANDPDRPGDPADSGGPGAPPGTERLSGRLVLVERSPGSKSERLAPLLEVHASSILGSDSEKAAAGEGASPPERLVLRREGANPFHDPELEALEGQVLIVEGERRGSHFLVRRYRVRGDDDPSGAAGAAGDLA